MKQIFCGDLAEISVSDPTVAVKPTNATNPAMESRSIRFDSIISTLVDIQIEFVKSYSPKLISKQKLTQSYQL